ncbi:hypothetical protein AB1L30_24770 [Bremerella sp. JC817]|uniref:hypothetical protein n=1 Tax=Bremerella sp. JC817 TaxID=3231756 RepID=UPI00345AC55B
MTSTIAPTIVANTTVWIYDETAGGLVASAGFPDMPAGALHHDFVMAAVAERRAMVRSVSDDTLEIAMPLLLTGEAAGAVLFTVHTPPECKIAIEIWTRTERDELGLHQSVYRGLERFERISPYVKFPRGSGLPGETWDDRKSRIIARLDQSKAFMRAAGAREEGLRYGLGIPVMATEHELDSVLVILSTVDFPFQQAMETWVPNADQTELSRVQTSYAEGIKPSERDQVAYGEGLIGQCFASRIPQLTTSADEDASLGPIFDQGARFALALPVFNGDRLVQIVTLFV